MNNFNFTHKPWKRINDCVRGEIYNIVKGKEIFTKVMGQTDHGWDVVNYHFLVNISQIARQIGLSRKTIRQELIKGSLVEPTNTIYDPHRYIYLSERSIQNRLNTLAKIKHRQLKLLQYPLLQQYVTLRLKQKYSLKVIGSVIELHPEVVDGIVCFKTLYNAIDDNRISFIDRKALRHIRKRKQRHKPHGKRMNGPSIETRTEEINDRKTFAHFEGDLIEGKRGTNCHLLTLCERLSRKGFAIKIFGKCPESVLKAIEKLQLDKVLNFGINIKSLTLDNGVEFWEWIKMSLSIHTKLSAIAIYFCHPYSSYEKGSIENFNGLVRWHFPKGTDFRNYSQAQIDDVVNWINNYPREIHNYQSANEVYNQYVQN